MPAIRADKDSVVAKNVAGVARSYDAIALRQIKRREQLEKT
jgi:hypothetical protein